MTPWRRLEYLGEYWAGRLLLLGVQSLPLPTAVRLGERAGRHAAPWTRRKFALAVDNIRHAFPEMSQADVEELALRTFEHFGRVAVEVAFARRLLRDSTYKGHIIVRNEPYLREVLAAGKGGILLTPHLGLWDLFGELAGKLGLQLSGVYRPLKNPYFDRLIRSHQAAAGLSMIPKRNALPDLLRVLRRGGYIGLLPDQHAGDRGPWLPFFAGLPQRRRHRPSWRSGRARRSSRDTRAACPGYINSNCSTTSRSSPVRPGHRWRTCGGSRSTSRAGSRVTCGSRRSSISGFTAAGGPRHRRSWRKGHRMSDALVRLIETAGNRAYRSSAT